MIDHSPLAPVGFWKYVEHEILSESGILRRWSVCDKLVLAHFPRIGSNRGPIANRGWLVRRGLR